MFRIDDVYVHSVLYLCIELRKFVLVLAWDARNWDTEIKSAYIDRFAIYMFNCVNFSYYVSISSIVVLALDT
jgi:hypothetical protein